MWFFLVTKESWQHLPPIRQTQGRPATPPTPLPPSSTWKCQRAHRITVLSERGWLNDARPSLCTSIRGGEGWKMYVAHGSNFGNCHQRWSWPSKVLFQKECVASYSNSILSHLKKESISYALAFFCGQETWKSSEPRFRKSRDLGKKKIRDKSVEFSS